MPFLMSESRRLRVALIAGTLGDGGAEKQLLYMTRALLSTGAKVRVYSLTRGEFYETPLRSLGVEPVWVGAASHPLVRLPALARMLSRFKPQIIQSAHAFVNLYAAFVARLLGALSVGAMRNSLKFSNEASGIWKRWVVTAPNAMVVNSQSAWQEITAAKLVHARQLYLVPNAMDLDEFDAVRSNHTVPPATAIFVGRLISLKRVDRFLDSLAAARQLHPSLTGIVVGDGPERASAETRARQLGLNPGHVTFLGRRGDVPALLRQAAMLVFCSEDEGCPNVILEAMAARIPVITTPAGDATVMVQDGVTGYVVPFDGVQEMSDRMVRLAVSPHLGRAMGEAGRRRVEREYGLSALAENLLRVYRTAAQQRKRGDLLSRLADPASLA